MTVYLVMAGEYEPWVDRIFSTREGAECYLDYVNKDNVPYHDKLYIERVEMDSVDVDYTKNLYEVSMFIDGAVHRINCINSRWDSYVNICYITSMTDSNSRLIMYFIALAESEEEFLRIANDKRMQLLDDGNFILGYRET